MDDVDIDKIIASNKVSFKKGYKYFIGYKDGEEVIPLCIRVPQINSNARILEGTECMSFFIPADELLEKCNKIWNKVSNNIKKDFNSKPAANEKYPETKNRDHENKVNTDFYGKGMP